MPPAASPTLLISTPPSWFEWLTVGAIVVGPIFALLAQRLLDYLREKRERRVRLFIALMTTRASQLAPDHINALNSIDIVFSRKRDLKIREAWENVRTHLATNVNAPDWQTKLSDRKANLYREIAVRVGYGHFTAEYLKYEVYLPTYYGEMERDQLKIRQALTAALTPDGIKIIPGNVGTSQTAGTTAQGTPPPPAANTQVQEHSPPEPRATTPKP